MARPKSEDKPKAILAAALAIFAKKGIWATPTSAISKAADVAEGTLFTYFSTKDILLNELYRALKLELAGALLADFPERADLRSKFYHIWERYVHWGIENPDKFKILKQLDLSDQINAESRAVGYASFAEIERLATDSIRVKLFHDYPVSFIAALFNSMAETTMATATKPNNSRITAAIATKASAPSMTPDSTMAPTAFVPSYSSMGTTARMGTVTDESTSIDIDYCASGFEVFWRSIART